jgi:hypothetical protein
MFNAIQDNSKTKIDLKLIEDMWTAYDQFNLSKMEDVFDIFEILLKNNGIRTTHMVGWMQDFKMPYFNNRYQQTFMYVDEEAYEEDSYFTSMFDQLNCNDFKDAWTIKLKNYFIWLGYKII